jgi:hypothetical protein
MISAMRRGTMVEARMTMGIIKSRDDYLLEETSLRP